MNNGRPARRKSPARTRRDAPRAREKGTDGSLPQKAEEASAFIIFLQVFFRSEPGPDVPEGAMRQYRQGLRSAPGSGLAEKHAGTRILVVAVFRIVSAGEVRQEALSSNQGAVTGIRSLLLRRKSGVRSFVLIRTRRLRSLFCGKKQPPPLRNAAFFLHVERKGA